MLAELLDLDRVKRTGLVEQRLIALEDQVRQKLNNCLGKVGFSKGVSQLNHSIRESSSESIPL